MAWLASLPGRLLERSGNGSPRGMAATQPGTPGCAQNPAYRATFQLDFAGFANRHPRFGVAIFYWATEKIFLWITLWVFLIRYFKCRFWPIDLYGYFAGRFSAKSALTPCCH